MQKTISEFENLTNKKPDDEILWGTTKYSADSFLVPPDEYMRINNHWYYNSAYPIVCPERLNVYHIYFLITDAYFEGDM